MNEEKKAALQSLNALELMEKKISIIKDLEKAVQKTNGLNLLKASERNKLSKEMDKIRDVLADLAEVEKIIDEKDF